MAEYESLSGLFTDIADAIRDKTGNEELIQAEAFPEAIAGLDVKTGPDTSAAQIIDRTITEYMDNGGYIKYIGSSAMTHCTLLTRASFPSCSQIGMWAMYGCTSLSTITLGDLEEIDNYAFRDCTALMSIYLTGNKVATIGRYSFSSTPLAQSSFTGSHASVFVPAELVDAYKEESSWSAYTSRITAISED